MSLNFNDPEVRAELQRFTAERLRRGVMFPVDGAVHPGNTSIEIAADELLHAILCRFGVNYWTTTKDVETEPELEHVDEYVMRTISYPATWWEAVKERWLHRWCTVRYTTEDVVLQAVYRTTKVINRTVHACPHIHGEGEELHVQFLGKLNFADLESDE